MTYRRNCDNPEMLKRYEDFHAALERLKRCTRFWRQPDVYAAAQAEVDETIMEFFRYADKINGVNSKNGRPNNPIDSGRCHNDGTRTDF